MQFFTLEPEVAGALGPRTSMRKDVHPPIVDRVHYVFDGWLGDVLVESFAIFLVRDEARRRIQDADLGGAAFEDAEVEVSDEFRELYPDRNLPVFKWLRPDGVVGESDFACAPDGRLTVSARALAILQECGIDNALVEPVAR